MQTTAVEKDHLVLLGINVAIRPRPGSRSIVVRGVVDAQGSAIEAARLAMEEVNEGQSAARNLAVIVVGVRAKILRAACR